MLHLIEGAPRSFLNNRSGGYVSHPPKKDNPVGQKSESSNLLVETFTSRVLRSGNDAEALGTHSTSAADVRKKYKEAATMLHPDKQHGRDEAARRRTAMAWQRVSAAYSRVMAALGADMPDTG